MAESVVQRRSWPAWLSPRLRDAAYWVFFAVYSSITCLWLLLAAWSVVVSRIFYDAHEMHSMDATRIEHAQDLALSLVTLGMGFFLIWRTPDQFVARWFAIGLVGTSAGFSLTAHHFLDAVAPTAMNFSRMPISLAHTVFHLIAGVAYAGGLLLFPDGKLPRRSAGLWLGLIVLSVLLAVLLREGHEPALFIIFCGVAVLICGPLVQWLKSRDGNNAHDRAVSNAFFRAFAYATWLACAFAVFEGFFLWWGNYGHLLKATDGGFGFWPTLALTVLPPLLAAVGVVVFFGIVEYQMFGISKLAHRPGTANALITVVFGGYILFDSGLDRASELLGEAHIIVTLGLVAVAVVVGLALERSRDRIQDDCRRLVFGHAVDPALMFEEFVESLGAAVSPEEVTSALGLTLEHYVDASTIRLNVLLPGGQFAVYDWPPEQFNGGESLPLGRPGAELGALWISRDPSRGPLGSAEKQLTAGVGVQAALLVRAMKGLAPAGARVQLGAPDFSSRRAPTAPHPKRESKAGPAPTDEERGTR